jgi:hypothetical protein
MGAEGKLGYAISFAFLGDAELCCSQVEKARSLYNESVAGLREPDVGDNNFLGYPLRRLGQLAWRDRNYEHAISLCKESLRLNYEVSDPRGVMCCVSGFAAIAVAQGKFERAAVLMAAVETQLATIGIGMWYMDKMEYERNLTLLRTQLDEKVFNKFWSKGKKMSFEEAITFALEQA